MMSAACSIRARLDYKAGQGDKLSVETTYYRLSCMCHDEKKSIRNANLSNDEHLTRAPAAMVQLSLITVAHAYSTGQSIPNTPARKYSRHPEGESIRMQHSLC